MANNKYEKNKENDKKNKIDSSCEGPGVLQGLIQLFSGDKESNGKKSKEQESISRTDYYTLKKGKEESEKLGDLYAAIAKSEHEAAMLRTLYNKRRDIEKSYAEQVTGIRATLEEISAIGRRLPDNMRTAQDGEPLIYIAVWNTYIGRLKFTLPNIKNYIDGLNIPMQSFAIDKEKERALIKVGSLWNELTENFDIDERELSNRGYAKPKKRKDRKSADFSILKTAIDKALYSYKTLGTEYLATLNGRASSAQNDVARYSEIIPDSRKTEDLVRKFGVDLTKLLDDAEPLGKLDEYIGENEEVDLDRTIGEYWEKVKTFSEKADAFINQWNEIFNRPDTTKY